MILDVATLYLLTGLLVTSELRYAGRPIPAPRGILVALTWPLALAVEALRPRT